MIENTIFLDKDEYDTLQESAFKYNYLVRLILCNSYIKDKKLETRYYLPTKLEDFLASCEPNLYEEWKRTQIPED